MRETGYKSMRITFDNDAFEVEKFDDGSEEMEYAITVQCGASSTTVDFLTLDDIKYIINRIQEFIGGE